MNQLVYVRDRVVVGFGRGSKQLGCPTANIDNISDLTIETGIYCGLAQLVIKNEAEVQMETSSDKAYHEILEKLPFISPVTGMVCNFGYCPQFENKKKSLEVHILDRFDFNFYGAELRVLICKKMRDEAKYSSIEELKEAIRNDISNASNEVANFMEYQSNEQYFLSNSWEQRIVDRQNTR